MLFETFGIKEFYSILNSLNKNIEKLYIYLDINEIEPNNCKSEYLKYHILKLKDFNVYIIDNNEENHWTNINT